jgi:hypothetical protein
MTHAKRIAAAILVLSAGALRPEPARAETMHACRGFIDSIPATITAQGVWCLRHDLSTAITTGNAITVAANNVTVDCNGYKIGGLAAGDGSVANGIGATNRSNVTVRHCAVRGFATGISILGGSGHLVEDNRLDNNLLVGVVAQGSSSVVRHNLVYDTGGRIGAADAVGISAHGDIIGNRVSGLIADAANGRVIGIHSAGAEAVVRDNSVSGISLATLDGGFAYRNYGLYLTGPRSRASDNHLAGASLGNGIGIVTEYGPNFCLGNSVTGFGLGNIGDGCIAAGNLTVP